MKHNPKPLYSTRSKTPRWETYLAGIFALSLTACSAYAQTEEVDLSTIFNDPSAWNKNAATFVSDYKSLGFRMLDGDKTAMSSDAEHLRFLGHASCEVRVYFEADTLRRAEISVYNKGDAGIQTQTEFGTLVEATKAGISEFVKDKGTSAATSSPRVNYFIDRHQWLKCSPALQMEWAYIKPHRSGGKNVDFNAEFVKVLLVPNNASASMNSASGGKSALSLQNTLAINKNVKREASGDVWVDNIPMVDQGQKGYCAAATSERVLRYYGLDVDQHQIAQIANTAAVGGTSIDGMITAITSVGRQFQLDKKDLVSSDTSGSFERSSHVKLIEQYNSVAQRKKAPTIDWKSYLANNTIDLQKIWSAMNPAILLEARTNQKQAFTRFFDDIKNYTDEGVPIIWSCLVGMYPENPPLGQNGAFGHMRIIIGYNTKTGEVLYSDTWGPKHALKRMPVDQAWAMTKAMLVLKPRNVR